MKKKRLFEGTGSIEHESVLDLSHLDGCRLVTDHRSLRVGDDPCSYDTRSVVDCGPDSLDLEDILYQCEIIIGCIRMTHATLVGHLACGTDSVHTCDSRRHTFHTEGVRDLSDDGFIIAGVDDGSLVVDQDVVPGCVQGIVEGDTWKAFAEGLEFAGFRKSGDDGAIGIHGDE